MVTSAKEISDLAHGIDVDAGGNIGIGTASPTKKLHVQGGSDANVQMTSQSFRSGFFIDRPNTTTTMGSGLVMDSDQSFRLGTQAHYHVKMFQDGITQILGAGNIGISVDTSGNVGIGEASPQRSVVVKGSNGSTTSIQFQTPATGSAAGDGFGIGYDSNGKGFIWNYESSDIYIGGATSNTAVTIQGSSGDLVMDSGQIRLANLASDPSTPVTGGIYYNTTQNSVKVYNGSGWEIIKSSVTGTGGNSTYTFTDSSSISYKVHVFTSSGTFTVVGAGSVDIMVVAGGGGGGGSTAGGGGAGGLIFQQSVAVASGSHTITVGGGGAGSRKHNDGSPNNTNGANSSGLNYSAIGGGYGYSGGSTGSRLASSGGSGGGGGYYSGNDLVNTTHSGSGTSGQGNRGGYGNGGAQWGGAGGGGAGGVGIDQNSTRAGGAGLDMSSYFGTSVGVSGFFAGGGGGGQFNTGSNTPGGTGGGGQGGTGGSSIPTAGTANTGGGGGGGGFYQTGPGGGAGGSGIVLIRYGV